MARTRSRFRTVPFVAQMEVAECGAACLAMILGYFGHHLPLAEAREACGVSRDGASAYAMAHAAKRYGLTVEALSIDVHHLKTTPLPAILFWEFNHFVVLEKIGRRSATIIDPDAGRRTVSKKQLEKSFTGVALTFDVGPDFKKRDRNYESLGRYKELLKASIPGLSIVFGASLCLDVLGFLFPAANQILIDLVITPQQSRWLWAIGLTLVAGTIARAILLFLRGWIIQNLQFVLDLSLMGGFVVHLMNLPIAFFQTRTPGDLVRRVQDNTALRDLFTSRSVSTLLDALLLIGYAGLMLAYHSGLGLLVISLAVVRVILLLGMRDRILQAAATEIAAMGREGGALVEALSVPEVTKAFGTEGRMAARYTDRLVHRVNAGLDRRKLTGGIGYLMVLLDGASKAAIIGIGGTEVLADRMTIGVLSAFLMLQMLFSGPLESLVGVLNDLQMISRQLQRLDDVMETEREPTGDRDPGRLTGAIALENVAFRYGPSGPFVVEGVNISIRPGEKIAIVGRSGAGKSTLAKLILGLYLPTQGTVRFDGNDLRELDTAKVRSQVGVVLQEPFFFDDSIRANLSLSAGDLPIERLRNAARIACVDDVIEKTTDGYDSPMGQGGSMLSGGQRQRVAVARAIAHSPSVLLLDEATSSLDRDNEKRLHENIAAVSCTRVVIAHRLATVIDADRILVLDQGRIVDEGKYADLASRPGLFQELVQALNA